MKHKVVAGLMMAVTMIGAVALCGTPAWAASSDDGSSSSSCGGSFLGFYPWYEGLTDSDCNIKTPSGNGSGLASFVWTIVLNVVADMMLAIGYIAVGFIIYGGFLFITAQDDPGRVAKARKTLTFAVVGTIIGILASNIVHAFINVL